MFLPHRLGDLFHLLYLVVCELQFFLHTLVIQEGAAAETATATRTPLRQRRPGQQRRQTQNQHAFTYDSHHLFPPKGTPRWETLHLVILYSTAIDLRSFARSIVL